MERTRNSYLGIYEDTYMANIHQDKHSIKNMQVVPQIAFTLLTLVRPINVGFSSRFFCLLDKRFLSIIIKKKFEEDNSEGAFFSAENCVFWGV